MCSYCPLVLFETVITYERKAISLKKDLAYPPQYLMLCVTLYHDNMFHLGRTCVILDVWPLAHEQY